MAEYQSAEHPQRFGPPNARPTIGYLATAIHEASQPQWLGVVDAAQKREVNLICFPGSALRFSLGFQDQANILYDLVSAESVDGLVSWASSIGNNVTADEIRAFHERYRPLPVVAIGRSWEGIPGLSMESYDGMREAVAHLIQVHQCRRLAFIRGPEGHLQAQARYQAYADALEAYGIPFDPNLVTPPRGWDASMGGEAMRLLLDERGLRPGIDLDAIVATNDGLLLGALQVLRARGFQVPDDLAAVGFDNNLQGRVNTPPLTTVAAPYYELGYRAVETARALIEGEPVSQETLVASQIVIRQSCGCLNPAVAQAKLESVGAGHETIESVLVSRRAEVVAAIAQALGESNTAARDAVERLLNSFVGELKGESPGLFIRELDAALRQTMAADGDIVAWHGAISALRQQTLSCSKDPSLVLAEDLWQQARVAIGEVAQRAQAQAQLRADQQTQILREIGAALLTTFDMRGLMDVLAERLPNVGIPSGYLSLYEAPLPYQYLQPPAEWSRLVLGYDEKGRIELEPEGRRFPSRQLVPEGMLPQERRYSFVAEPLFFQNNQIGFALFEMGPREASVYEVLRVQISSALQGAALIRRVENRALQFQTVTQVSRATSSILDLDKLIQQVVNVIQEQFGLYYVGLFLTEQTGEPTGEPGQWATLRAGTGEAGRLMMDQGHRLEISDASMVGWAISHKQARIALDVGHAEQVVRFSNPLLPATRSEIALPLISRGEVIGALDVQSAQPEAFSDEDVAVLQTMADQVALAIGNARLFQQVQASLEAERRAYGELSRQAWQQLLQTRSGLSFVCDERGLAPARDALEPHMQEAARMGAPVLAKDDQGAVALPIKVRDQVIGVIDARKPERGDWTKEQIALLETLTEQLGVALESARLYQDTRRRAAQERLIGEVTARMRESLDIDQVLQTAAHQVGQALGAHEVNIRLTIAEKEEQL